MPIDTLHDFSSWYSPPAAARLLKISRQRLHQLILDGSLQVILLPARSGNRKRVLIAPQTVQARLDTPLGPYEARFQAGRRSTVCNHPLSDETVYKSGKYYKCKLCHDSTVLRGKLA